MLKNLFIILLLLSLVIMSSCSFLTSTVPPPAQLNEVVKQNIVRIDLMWGNFPEPANVTRQKWLQTNVMDHCPIYAEFNASMDTD